MITGKQVVLAPLEPGDLDQSRAWANDEQVRNGVLRVLPVTAQGQDKWYRSVVEDPAKMVFAIRAKSGRRHVGNTGFYHIDLLHRRAEFWIIIGSQNDRGQGFGKDVLAAMLDYGFNGLNLNKIYLHVGADNAPAIALYEGAGFSMDGRLRDHYYICGRFVDVLAMSILKTESGCHGSNQ